MLMEGNIGTLNLLYPTIPGMKEKYDSRVTMVKNITGPSPCVKAPLKEMTSSDIGIWSRFCSDIPSVK